MLRLRPTGWQCLWETLDGGEWRGIAAHDESDQQLAWRFATN